MWQAALEAAGLSRSTARVVGGASDYPTLAVTGADGTTMAVRVRPSARHQDSEREARILALAREARIPCPRVCQLLATAEGSVLVTSWEPGRPLLEEVLTMPDEAHRLGRLAGGMQARLHAWAPPPDQVSHHSWASPRSPHEAALLGACPVAGRALLHLDYHPLNVLTDGQAITAVVDWVNAAIGDPRQDLARSLAILLLAFRFHPDAPEGVADLAILMARGWWDGYREASGRDDWDSFPAFLAWAGAATLRDLQSKTAPEPYQRMQETARRWEQLKTIPDWLR
jgi:aminoglycoside phosphotransferase (APT) family kinase protein